MAGAESELRPRAIANGAQGLRILWRGSRGAFLFDHLTDDTVNPPEAQGLWVRFVEREMVHNKILAAGSRIEPLGDQIDPKPRRVPELLHNWLGLLVAELARRERRDLARSNRVDVLNGLLPQRLLLYGISLATRSCAAGMPPRLPSPPAWPSSRVSHTW